MKTLRNTTAIKANWVIIAPFSGGFNRNYRSALRKAGFQDISAYGIYAVHFNPDNEASVERIKNQLKKLDEKLSTYKYKKALFSFVISDKQFGYIDTDKAEFLSERTGWLSVPISKGTLAVTYNQMYASGGIDITGSQCEGKFGKNFKNEEVEHFYY